MCKRYTNTAYHCYHPGKCPLRGRRFPQLEVFDSHCEITGNDVPWFENGEARTCTNPTTDDSKKYLNNSTEDARCPYHSGIQGNQGIDPAQFVRQDKSYLWARSKRAQDRGTKRLWLKNPNRYQLDLPTIGGVKQTPSTMAKTEWTDYFRHVFDGRADETLGMLYDLSTEPWGDAREGGALGEFSQGTTPSGFVSNMQKTWKALERDLAKSAMAPANPWINNNPMGGTAGSDPFPPSQAGRGGYTHAAPNPAAGQTSAYAPPDHSGRGGSENTPRNPAVRWAPSYNPTKPPKKGGVRGAPQYTPADETGGGGYTNPPQNPAPRRSLTNHPPPNQPHLNYYPLLPLDPAPRRSLTNPVVNSIDEYGNPVPLLDPSIIRTRTNPPTQQGGGFPANRPPGQAGRPGPANFPPTGQGRPPPPPSSSGDPFKRGTAKVSSSKTAKSGHTVPAAAKTDKHARAAPPPTAAPKPVAAPKSKATVAPQAAAKPKSQAPLSRAAKPTSGGIFGGSSVKTASSKGKEKDKDNVKRKK